MGNIAELMKLVALLPVEPQEAPKIKGINKPNAWIHREERLGYGSSASYKATRIGNTDNFKITRLAQGRIEQYDLLLTKGERQTQGMLDFLIAHDAIMHNLLQGYEVEGYSDPLDLWLEGWTATRQQ